MIFKPLAYIEYAHTHAHTYTRHIRTHAYTYTRYIRTRAYTHHAHTHTHTHVTYTHARTHTRTYTRTRNHVHTHCCVQVGSNWDAKESIFRNYGNILGVWDDPVAAVRLLTTGNNNNNNNNNNNGGGPIEAEIEWVDPVGVVVSSYVMKMDASWFVAFHKPKLERPIRPGLWSVRLRGKGVAGGWAEPLFRTDFAVVPLTHENKKPLLSPQDVNAVRGRGRGVKGHEGEQLFGVWKRNASMSGARLEGWVDDLVFQYWAVGGYCVGSALASQSSFNDNNNNNNNNNNNSDGGGGRGFKGEGCGDWMPDCHVIEWSTLHPDPKSELGEVRPNGRLR